jgi:hypothetical protein
MKESEGVTSHKTAFFIVTAVLITCSSDEVFDTSHVAEGEEYIQ